MTDHAPLLRLSWLLAGLTIGSQILWVLVSGGVRDLFTVAGVVLFFLTSVTHSLATQPLAWTVRFFAVTLSFGWVIEAVGTGTGFPFGAYEYTADGLGPSLGAVPAVIPLAWAMMGYPVYVIVARACRGATARVALAAVLLASWDLFLDPQMVSEGHWAFADPTPALPGVPGIPLSNFAGWLLATAIVMTLVELIAGPPDPPVDLRSPVALMLAWVYASNVLANAVFFGRPVVALIGAVGMGVPLAFVIRGLRRDASSELVIDR